MQRLKGGAPTAYVHVVVNPRQFCISSVRAYWQTNVLEVSSAHLWLIYKLWVVK